MYIRISGAPKGFVAWVANRTMLEVCMKKVGILDSVDYQKIPAYAPWFSPANGETPLEAAKNAVSL